MKLRAMAVIAAATMIAGAAAAQDMAPPVTMQPIPNPPEPAHHAKHHKMAKPHKMVDPKADATPK
jgi:hypothetical protein